MEYKFKSKWQEDAEANEKKKLLQEQKLSEGKKLLKETTFMVTTIDDALATIEVCMELIATKKRNVMTFTDLIGSAIVTGATGIAQNMIPASVDGERVDNFAAQIKKRILMIIRNSLRI